jgi:hypothetical protein
LNQYSDILKEYFEKIQLQVLRQQAMQSKITGVKRSPTQVREFMKRTGLRLKWGTCRKVSRKKKIEEVEK